MTLPLLLSVPHAGLWVPPEVEDMCILTRRQIVEDGDEGAAEIYLPLEKETAGFVTTKVARAIVDQNRAQDDFQKDGVVKTHTSWDVPIYREFPSETIVRTLIDKYYKPYHSALSELSKRVRLGVDCHTMAAEGPPVGPDPGVERPTVCLSNGDGTCPQPWIEFFAQCLEDALKVRVSINRPFRGGHIIRSHCRELPWIQLEYSRAPFATDAEKRSGFINALKKFCKDILGT